MSYLLTGWVVVASACVSLALVQLVIWIRRQGEVSHLIFALTTLAGAGVAIAEIRMSRATSIEAFVGGFKFSNYCVAAMLIGLTWFVVTYAGARAGVLAWSATAGWLAGVVLNAVRPLGLSLAEVSGLSQEVTGWGETYTVATASTDATKWLADLSTVAVLALAALQAYRLYRAGRRRPAALLGAIALFMAIALVHTTLVDLGLLASPYLISYLFAGIVVVTSYQLAAEVADASVLSVAARADERRWHGLLEGVGLLVVRFRPDGVIDYVNPHFCSVTGYPPDEVVGRHYLKFLVEKERESVGQRFEAMMAGRPEPPFRAQLRTRDAAELTIAWRGVAVHHTDGVSVEVLGIGADITVRVEAERSRDAALEEIAALKAQLEEENLYLKEEIKLQAGGSTEMVGDSEALRYVLFRMEKVAATSTTVLIQGETGVGKELVARALHEASQRADGPYIRLNCTTLPANLVESELFGHVAGAFTDAKGARKGRFELADGGTLFLDEVSELPREVQPKLLRVLQEGEFEPVGSSETRKTDVRVIAATNRNLEQEVQAGRFREDLFYRLHVYPITVPPLRDRKDDIPLLVEHFLPRISARSGRSIKEVPAGVLRALGSYSWPGNVRQLQNVLEESVVASSDGVLRLVTQLESAVAPGSDLRTLSQIERDHILAVLEATRGQIAGRGGAAEILDLHPNTLRSRMKKLGLSAQASTSRSG